MGMFAMGYFSGVGIDLFGQKLVAAAGVVLLFCGYMLLRATVQVCLLAVSRAANFPHTSVRARLSLA